MATPLTYDLAPSAARTASGSSTPIDGAGAWTTIRAQLLVTAASGTTPTLDVVLEDSLDGVNWNTIATFQQKTGASREVVNVTTPFGENVRARWTVGGTVPSFTFSVITFLE